MKANHLLPYVLLAWSPLILAQQQPSAGSQMQQIPVVPAPQKEVPKIDVAPVPPPVTAEASAVKIVVNRLNLMGGTVYSNAELIALTGFTAGEELSLTDLRAMAIKIANHYRRNGYFVAQAYLPAQDIKDGIVAIAVIEGRYGQVKLRNQAKFSEALANTLVTGINSGDLVQSAPLETRLLLLSDIPGVTVRSTLTPGTAPGSSDLLIDLTPAPFISGEVDADNAGNRYTGEYRLGATVNFNNLTGNGDLATLRAMTAGSGLNYLRGAYQIPVGKARVGVAYSALEYELGKEFKHLKAHGTAEIASIYGSYPLIRSRASNLYAGLVYDYKTFQDKEDVTNSVTDKKADVLLASLYGDHRDNFGGGGMSSFSLTWSVGDIDIQTPSAWRADAATAKSNGSYDKLAFTAMRLQNLTPAVSLYAAINGQVASKNLDASEKMELGGMYGVRAYPEGEAYADEGYVLNLEARVPLRKFSDSMAGQMQFVAFVDTGHVTTHKNPWTAGSNSRTLSAIGVGLNWSKVNDYLVRTYYAVKLGNDDAISAPDKSGRFWIQLVKYF